MKSTAGNGKRLAATTCAPGSKLDSNVFAFTEGVCENPNYVEGMNNPYCVGSNEDIGSSCTTNPFSSRVEWCSQQNATYLVAVGAWGNFHDEFVISVDTVGDCHGKSCSFLGSVFFSFVSFLSFACFFLFCLHFL